jgi:abhydrolase domain-containing protein 6
MKLSRCVCLLISLMLDLLPGVTPAATTCEFTQGQTPVEDGSIVYNQYGQGPTIVLLHGLFADKEQWHKLSCLLEAAGYSVIAPDLPGYGKSVGFPLPDYRLENQVKLLHQFLDALSIRRYHVAGSSMGGTIAAMISREYSHEVRSLAFIGSPQGIIEWSPELQAAIAVGINPFIPIDVDQFDLEMSLLFVTPPVIPIEIKEATVNEYVTQNRHYQQVWDIDNLYTTQLTKGHWDGKPTLIIWGQKDQIFSVKGARKLKARIPRARVIRLPDAGHLLMMENSTEAARFYLPFLQRH